MFEKYVDNIQEMICDASPVHSLSDREYWEKLRPHIDKKFQDMVVSYGSLPATRFMDFYYNGNRSEYEIPYYNNLRALSKFALTEAAHNDGKNMENLVDCLWVVLEESTWSLPAHQGHGNVSDALPDPYNHILDLFQAETGAIVATVYAIFREKFDEISKNINRRILKELNDRVIRPFHDNNDYWWMGTAGNRVNNWNPWIISNLMLTAMIIGDRSIYPKALILLEKYVASTSEDGGCDEGPNYWFKAGATLITCTIYLKMLTNGKIDLSADKRIINCSEFLMNCFLYHNHFINFADGHPIITYSYGTVFKLAEFTGNEKLYDFALSFRNEDHKSYCTHEIIWNMEADASFEGKATKEIDIGNIYYDSLQMLIVRQNNFTLAIKGGNNDESHNHNDVGSFIISRGDNTFLIDTGSKRYCKDTFSDKRYTIWVNRSVYHNLPEIGGCEQSVGKSFCATNVSHGDNWFEGDISKAYDSDNIIKWIRRAEVTDKITIKETYEFKTPTSSVLHFLTAFEPEKISDGLLLTAPDGTRVRMKFKGDFTYDKVSTDNDCFLIEAWGDYVYRINIVLPKTISGEFEYTIEEELL